MCSQTFLPHLFCSPSTIVQAARVFPASSICQTPCILTCLILISPLHCMEHSNFKIQIVLKWSFQSFPRYLQVHHLLEKTTVPLFIFQWPSLLVMFDIYHMPSFVILEGYLLRKVITVLLFSFKMIGPSNAMYGIRYVLTKLMLN